MPTQTTLKQVLIQRASIGRMSTVAFIVAVFVFFMAPKTFYELVFLEGDDTVSLAFKAAMMMVVGATLIPSLSFLNPIGATRFVLLKPHAIAFVFKVLLLIMIDVTLMPRPLWTWVGFVLLSIGALIIETVALQRIKPLQEQDLRVRIVTRNRSLGDKKDRYESVAKYFIHTIAAAIVFGLLNFLDLLSYVAWVLVFYVVIGVISMLVNAKILKQSQRRLVISWTLIMMIVSSVIRIALRDVFAGYIVIGSMMAFVTFLPLLSVLFYVHLRVIEDADLHALMPVKQQGVKKEETT